MKKTIISILVSLPLVIAILLLSGWYYYHTLYNDYRTESAVRHEAGDSLSTNSIAAFTDEEIAVYGKWADKTDHGAYTVFSLDDAGDGFYWGKEWNEADNIFEDDLDEYGNGWFRWKTKKNSLLILYNSNYGFSVPIEYAITDLKDESLGIQRKLTKSQFHLSRAYN